MASPTDMGIPEGIRASGIVRVARDPSALGMRLQGAPREIRILRPLRDTPGGIRPNLVADFECPKGCRGTPFKAWHDFTSFIPDPLSKEEFPPGVCELRSELLEILFCSSGDPLQQCPLFVRQLGEWTVALQATNNEARCQIHFFKPFHRTGQEDDLSISERDEFGDVAAGATQSYCIGNNFVSNFRRTDMSIIGDPWLRLEDGWLYGAPPRLGAANRYEFTITARNGNGTDAVTLAIIVSP